MRARVHTHTHTHSHTLSLQATYADITRTHVHAHTLQQTRPNSRTRTRTHTHTHYSIRLGVVQSEAILYGEYSVATGMCRGYVSVSLPHSASRAGVRAGLSLPRESRTPSPRHHLYWFREDVLFFVCLLPFLSSFYLRARARCLALALDRVLSHWLCLAVCL